MQWDTRHLMSLINKMNTAWLPSQSPSACTLSSSENQTITEDAGSVLRLHAAQSVQSMCMWFEGGVPERDEHFSGACQVYKDIHYTYRVKHLD